MKQRIIQVIGLPGSGKTTTINKFVSAHPDVTFLDYATNKIKNTYYKNYKYCIIESACGFSNIPSNVVQLRIPKTQWITQLTKRDGVIDHYYMSLLESQMIVPDSVVNSSEELFGYLSLNYA